MDKSAQEPLYSIGEYLKKRKFNEEDLESSMEGEIGLLDKILMMGNQFYYIVEVPNLDLLYINPGFCKVLNHSECPDHIDPLYNLLHPDDQSVVFEAIRKMISLLSKTDKPFENTFYLNYRVLDGNGKYVRVHRQTTSLEYTSDGKLLSIISLITNTSHLEKRSKKVNCSLTGPLSEKFNFPDKELKTYIKDNSILTNREIQILGELYKGKTSQEVADFLFISVHTVDKHRRNMLYKTKCKNTRELLNFAIRNNLF